MNFMNYDIVVENLTKTFDKNKPNKGTNLFQKLYYYIKPEKEIVNALKNISFKIKSGSIVGVIGANGAGKTTLIKNLTGILTPDSGKINCLGYTPYLQREDYVKNIGVIFGSRGILLYSLPVIESLKYYGVVFDIPYKDIDKRIEHLTNIMDIKSFLHTPVRKLSLGQRMRAHIAAIFMHKPKIVYLDEPTIGLDALAKHNMRQFLKRINKEENTTIILTTHDMKDIEELCEDVIVINNGQITYNGNLNKFKTENLKYKLIKLEYNTITNKKEFLDAKSKTRIIRDDNYFLECELPINDKNTLNKLITSVEIDNIVIEEQTLEQIIREIYKNM